MPILNRIMVAGGLLGIALVAVLYAQSPGLFSTLEVDATTRLRDTLRVDGALTLTLEDQITKRDIAAAAVGQGQLDTATGTSTGAGRRTVTQPEYSFAPELSGDPLCVMATGYQGWEIFTLPLSGITSQWGGYTITIDGASSFGGLTASGSNLWHLDGATLRRMPQSNPSNDTSWFLTFLSGRSYRAGITASGSDLWILSRQSLTTRVARVSQADPATLIEEFALATVSGADNREIRSLTAVGADLWVAHNFLRRFQRVSQADPTTLIEEFDFPAGMGSEIDGLTSVGSDTLWALESTFPIPSAWKMTLPQTDPPTGQEFTLDIASQYSQFNFNAANGFASTDDDLWVLVRRGNNGRVLRVPQINPGATECIGANTLAWRYINP